MRHEKHTKFKKLTSQERYTVSQTTQSSTRSMTAHSLYTLYSQLASLTGVIFIMLVHSVAVAATSTTFSSLLLGGWAFYSSESQYLIHLIVFQLS